MSGKKRSVYSGLDKEVFKQVLKKYAAVVENKKTDGATVKAKESAWEKVASDFNAITTISEQRSAAQLKKLWSNMKQQARDQMTKERQSHFATGGGPPLPEEPIDTEVLGMAPYLMITVPAVIDSEMTAGEIRALTTPLDVIELDNPACIFDEEDIDSPASPASVPSLSGEEQEATTSSSCLSNCSSPLPSVMKPTASPRFLPPFPSSKRRKVFSECSTGASALSSTLSSAAKEEADIRLSRQKKLIEQDEILFQMKKAQAEEELQTAKLKRELAALQLADMKRRIADDDIV